jgi:hypothetical protein
MDAAGSIGLSMRLYRIVRDDQTLNRPARPLPGNLRKVTRCRCARII